MRVHIPDLRPLAAFLLAAASALGLFLVWDHRPAANASSAAGGAVPVTASGAPGAPAAPVADGPIVPVRLAIPAIGVNAAVEPRGTVRSTNPFTGQVVEAFGVPKSMRTVAWWSDGPKPGSGQMAVLLGHQQVGGDGVFNRLARLRPGATVDLYDRSGSVLHLRVLAAPLTGLDKSTSALARALDGHPPGADLALVTCGGRFDQSVRQSVDNTVVFATVVR